MTSYRKNVAAIILDKDGRILLCRRSDHFKNWQLPQGGIDKGEDALTAVMRELEEEIGTNKFELIGKLEESVCYDWPKELHSRGFIGQEQWYFLFRDTGSANIQLPSEEFDAMKWVSKSEFLKEANSFKAEAYKEAIEKFIELFPSTIYE